MIVFYLLSGGLSNVSNYNAFVSGLTYISPIRYSVEFFFRIVIYNNPHWSDSDPTATDPVPDESSQDVLDSLGFDIGLSKCFIALIIFIFIFLILGNIIIVRRNRKFL